MVYGGHSDLKNPWKIIFQVRGSIWMMVLPYCILNCVALVVVVYLQENQQIRIRFSPKGHALMSLLIAYLVVSKVTLAFNRYMSLRFAIGCAFLAIRETYQLAMLFTEDEVTEEADNFRSSLKLQLLELINCTGRVIKNERHAAQLAQAEYPDYTEDPMTNILHLRNHIYKEMQKLNPEKIELLERMRLIDKLHEYVVAYNKLLELLSTPVPFPLVQMGRTFLFLWVFSMPLVLMGVVDEIYSGILFLFFLTYGFMGIEFVCMKLHDPFTDDSKLINVSGMQEATVSGIEIDYMNATGFMDISRIQSTRTGSTAKTGEGRYSIRPSLRTKSEEDYETSATSYHAFHGGSYE